MLNTPSVVFAGKLSGGVGPIRNKSPGRLTFADVTLERGAAQHHDLFDWF